MSQTKILLVQLASNGDCLFVTTIARQIKEVDYPDCHLTWLIGSNCTQVIRNNPFIDVVVEIPINNIEEIAYQRNQIPQSIEALGGYKNFSEIFITDYTTVNYSNWFGTTRSSLFRSYPHKLKVEPQPLIYLSTHEKRKVLEFSCENRITKNTFNILFECVPRSGQSHMTIQKAKEIAEEVLLKNKNIKFILSSNHSFISNNPSIIDGSQVTWRENAELANYCSLLIGCSSGISWLCTSNWTQSLQMIQVINPKYMSGKFSASMKMDFKYFGLDTHDLIELHNPTDEILVKCILDASFNNFYKAKKKYDTIDSKPFSKLKFIIEAQIPLYEKVFHIIFNYSNHLLKQLYRSYKPKWFTPSIFLKKIVK